MCNRWFLKQFRDFGFCVISVVTRTLRVKFSCNEIETRKLYAKTSHNSDAPVRALWRRRRRAAPRGAPLEGVRRPRGLRAVLLRWQGGGARAYAALRLCRQPLFAACCAARPVLAPRTQ